MSKKRIQNKHNKKGFDDEYLNPNAQYHHDDDVDDKAAREAARRVIRKQKKSLQSLSEK